MEHDGSRTQYAHLLDEHYREEYEAVFGPLPDFSDRDRFPDVAGPIAGNPAALANWEAMAPEDQELVTQPAPAGNSELEALNLNATEQAQLLAFLHTLEGPLSTDPTWLRDPSP